MHSLRLAGLFLAGLLLLGACQSSSRPFHGADLGGAQYGQTWTLIDGNGKNRTLGDYRGEVLLVYFGFTHCPDVCPLTLGHLQSALTSLGAEQDRARVLFITVDAENETPAAMRDYLMPFGPRFTGLSGNAEALSAAAKDFKVYAARKGTASFEHAGFIFAFDPKGRARVLSGPEVPPADIAADVLRLLRE